MAADLSVRPKDALLRTAIRLDAAGVGLAGLGIAAFAGPFSRLTGLTSAWSYGFAGFFVFYGIALTWLARQHNIRPIGTGLSLFNFLYAAGEFALVAAAALALTGAGKVVMVLFGLWAVVFGVLQLMGVRRLA